MFRKHPKETGNPKVKYFNALENGAPVFNYLGQVVKMNIR
jgi:hypothetical protein